MVLWGGEDECQLMDWEGQTEPPSVGWRGMRRSEPSECSQFHAIPNLLSDYADKYGPTPHLLIMGRRQSGVDSVLTPLNYNQRL